MFDAKKLSDAIMDECKAAGTDQACSYAETCGRLQTLLDMAMAGDTKAVQERYDEIVGGES